MVHTFFFYDAIGVQVMMAGSCMFEVIFLGAGVTFFETEGPPVFTEHFLRGSFKTK